MLNLLKDYAIKRTELLKLEATEKTALSIGTTVFLLLISIALLFFIILLNIGLGFLLSSYLDSYTLGFLVVSGLYFLVFLMFLLMKNSIKNAIANKIIQFINE
jgi:hypothetical protein